MTDTNKLLAFSSDKSDNSNYVNLPESMLTNLVDKKIEQPYYFSITSPQGIKTWVGVRQFTADDKTINIPRWIMDHLCMFENSQYVTVELEQDIPKGKKAVIEPQQEDFFSIPEYDGCLENILSDFCILHRNQKIEIELLDKKYNFLIKEVEVDWETVNYDGENTNLILSEGIIDIKNIDLTVDVVNKFLKPENNHVDKKIDKKEDIDEDLIPKNNQLKGLRLSNDTKTLNKEEMINARLKYYDKKFGIEI